MDHTLSGDGVEITDALRAHVGEKLARLDGQGTETTRVQVTLRTNGSEQTATGTLLQVDGQDLTPITAAASDMFVAVDKLADKLYSQVRRHTQREYGRPK
ncbi:ribosome hibernation-promoting factor, HPF/YfiA family [Streptomyces sp. NBC_00503]|uniref:ribosome hibernation-promoting factor, HPF/YfiA family n=1 Tax=Streptomyces sp. NBC_00503 TaxID=2903659 RepID=UPI002E7FC646|nr:ribosome-associated translation inhibitor RaiA [Streptomyces sp. NBC_00503]WUD79645.1 ribosome-associated translation inhibitor RaiA [Streptomyces sp. NBC_00503]